MSDKLSVVLAGSALLAALSGTAAAHGNVGFSISIGGPGYALPYGPAPVYAAPPVYYAPPQPVYYGPEYYAPAPVYYGPREYYAPPVVTYPRYYYPHHGWHRGHRW